MTNNPTNPHIAAEELVEAAKRIVILTHVNPDGDAIGSLMGLTLALRNLGKDVIPVVDGGTPHHLAFIPGSEGVHADLKDITADQIDLVISVDASDAPRIGEAGKLAIAFGKPIIVIDHHKTNTMFGTVNMVDDATPATAEVLLDWFDSMEISLTKDIAYCLLTGLVTDTLCFRVNSVTGDTLGKAHRLMAAGAPLNTICQQTVNRRSTGALRLWAHVMPTMQIADGVIWAVVDLASRKAAQYEEEGGAGGLVQLLNEADEANIAAVFVEKADSKVELHFRAQPGFDVATVALALGGGGHVLASGATVDGTLETVIARVIPLLKEAVQNGVPVLN